MTMSNRKFPDPGLVRVRIREYCKEHDLFMSTDAGLRLAEPNIDKMARLSGLGHTTLIPFLRFPGRRAAISFDTLARICALLGCQPGDILRYEPHAPDRHNMPADPTQRNMANTLGLS